MKKKTITKYVGTALLVLNAAVLVGCGGGSGGSGQTTISILQDAGTGTKEVPTWIEQCAERFVEANKETSFKAGQKGVKIRYKAEKGINYDTISSSGYNIFIDENSVDTFAYKSVMMDITEAVNPFVNKIDPSALLRCMPDQSKAEYYALPFYEWFPGISYDIDLFNDRHYYIADPSETDVYEYTTTVNSDIVVRFVNADNGVKSVGPDGVRGTTDDGLPSSLTELIALSDRVTYEGNVAFRLCGSGTQYSWYLVDALWASLAGEDAMRSIYCNFGDGGVTLNVVTGYTNEDLFFAGSGIKKPVVTPTVVTDENGYLIYSMVERYYALSFFQMIFKHGENNESWFANDTLTKTTQTAKAAQDYFINGNDDGSGNAFLYDSSYWYHEDIAEINRWNSEHEYENKKRNVAYMPMPTQLEGSVTENHGKQNTLMDVGSTYIFVNKNTKRDEGKEAATIAFLKFLYSNEELNDFSRVTGLTVPASYGYNTEGLDTYYSQLGTFREEAVVIPYSSTSSRFVKNMASFNIGYGSSLNNINGNREGYLKNLKDGMTARSIFDATCLTKTIWDGMQK